MCVVDDDGRDKSSLIYSIAQAISSHVLLYAVDMFGVFYMFAPE